MLLHHLQPFFLETIQNIDTCSLCIYIPQRKINGRNWCLHRTIYVRLLVSAIGYWQIETLEVGQNTASLSSASKLLIAHFMSMLCFYTPWKRQKLSSFMKLSGEIFEDKVPVVFPVMLYWISDCFPFSQYQGWVLSQNKGFWDKIEEI